MPFSDDLVSEIYSHLLRSSSWTKPTAIYVALFKTAPAADGTGGVEVTGTGYERKLHGPGDTYWTAMASRTTSNIGDIIYGAPASDWSTAGSPIVAVGLYSAIVGGTYHGQGTLEEARVISSGDPAPAFLDGELDITLT